MDDEGNDGDDLMGAAKTLCTAFGELLTATEPNSTQPRQYMLTAASQVGSASHRVLYTIGEEEVADKDRQDVLLGLAKAVANTTAALVLKAKNVASKCQEQLMEAAKEVAKSVEGCTTTCKDVGRDEKSLQELRSSAQDVTRALNDLLNHVKDGHTDKIPDIMEQILVASGELIASFDSGEMVRQARILAQSTAELIQAIKGEAETQSDSELQGGHQYEAPLSTCSTEGLQWQYSSDLLQQPPQIFLNNSIDNFVANNQQIDNQVVPTMRITKSFSSTSAAAVNHRRCSVYENVGL